MSLLSRYKKILGQDKKKKPAKKAVKKKIVKKQPEAVTLNFHMILTEKSLTAQEKNQVVFLVDPTANKYDIAQAVEATYGAGVVGVRTSNKMPKRRTRGLISGHTKNWKKAYVTVDNISKFNESEE